MSSLTSTITPPPPPPPPLENQISVSSNNSCKSATLKSNRTIGGLKTEKQVQEELKQVLMIFREKKEYYGKSVDREPVLDQYSTPREVQNWLTFKGYSEKICKQLRDMTGSEIFGLTKRQLEYYDIAEGAKLFNQILLARNENKTKNSRTSELKQILEKARHKIEEQ